MNELIKTNYDSNSDRVTVLGRDLHKALSVKTPYKDWFPRMCEYGFIEGTDFCTFLSESTGGRPATDHQITIDMAKELCMIQRSEKGKMFRQYFIEVEKDWNSPEKVMARALMISEQKLKALDKQIAEMTPKALFADSVSASEDSISVGDLAKLICQNGVEIGQNRLFKWLVSNGYIYKTYDGYMPMQRYMDMKLFELKETAINRSDGRIHTKLTVKITGKGQNYFINKFLNKLGRLV